MDTPNGMHGSPRICVIDDDDGFRIGMTRLLLLSGLAAVGYRCAGEFLIAQHDQRVACILLDISMPGPSGVDLLKALISRGEAPPVIFTTGHDNVFLTVDVMKAGAFDYIVKPVSAARILPSVHKAIELDAARRAARARVQELRARYETLTAAEQAIFQGIVGSKLNKQLAAELGTCERTIKSQRARMMHKLHITTIPELVRIAKALEMFTQPVAAPRLVRRDWRPDPRRSRA